MASDYDVLAVFLWSTAKDFVGQLCIVRYPVTVISPGRSCPGHPGGRGTARCRAQGGHHVHQREGIDRIAYSLPARLQDKLAAVAEAHGELAPLVPAMTPPALNSVGDKLHDAALTDAISRQGPPHRPYLLVQMPKFGLTKEQLASLVAYLESLTAAPRMLSASPA